MSESDLAVALRVDRQHIRDQMRSLAAKGLVAIVQRGPGYPSHFLLNCHVVWKGKYAADKQAVGVFGGNCSYQPVREIRYKERPAEVHTAEYTVEVERPKR